MISLDCRYARLDGEGIKPLFEVDDELKRAIDQLKKWKADQTAAFLHVDANAELDAVMGLAEGFAKNVRDVLVLGIGGSALGLKCLARALLRPYHELTDSKRLFVLDNVDPEQVSSIFNLIDWEKLLVVVISKSGKTLETASQFFLTVERLKKKFGSGWKERVVAITDPQGGVLRKLVADEGLKSLPIPQKLGGRFSVISPVGLFPAALMGMDVKSIVSGARDFSSQCEVASVEENLSLKWANLNRILMKKDVNISVMMPYSYRLELLADWYLQLWAESLGKNGKGMTPVKALGATDQHSQLQLYMEGPRDKFVTFLVPTRFESAGLIEEPDPEFAYLKGKGLEKIIESECLATAAALSQVGCSNVTLKIGSENMAYSIGEAFMMFEAATALMGAMMGINPFDQPGVERGKVLAKGLLSN